MQKRGGLTRIAIMRDVASEAGVSLALLRSLDRGARVGQYDKAKAISKATGLTIAELCE